MRINYFSTPKEASEKMFVFISTFIKILCEESNDETMKFKFIGLIINCWI